MDKIFQVTRKLGKQNVRNIYFWHYSVRFLAVPSLPSVYDSEVHKSMCCAATSHRQEVLQADT